jgi:hypothetical protein
MTDREWSRVQMSVHRARCAKSDQRHERKSKDSFAVSQSVSTLRLNFDSLEVHQTDARTSYPPHCSAAQVQA